MWDSSVFSKALSFKGSNYLVTVGNLEGVNSPICVANIYAPCQNDARFTIWAELSTLISSNPGAWILMGDFNELRSRTEHIGSSFSTSNALKLNNFIREAGLSEINLDKRKFTWINEDGTYMSKLDRVFVSSDILSLWPTIRKIDDLKKKVAESEPAAELSNPSSEDLDDRKELKKDIQDLEYARSLDLKQKERIKWLIDGDENSSQFHRVTNAKKNRYRINGLTINGRWESNPKAILDEVFNFFSSKFQENMPIRPKLLSLLFKKLLDTGRSFLEAPFTLEEIKLVVWSCGEDKAPGPDGLTFKFIKHFWDTLNEDILNMVCNFERNGAISQGCNSSFISLFPKVDDPLSLRYFRLISLIGCTYKIISKLLAIRLKQVVNKAKRYKFKTLLFKVDLKAFYCLSWTYLDSIMEQMNFGDTWRSWICGCLRSARASVLVNGSATNEFPLSRGVCQGDPLSPFLFIIAMEGLHVPMLEALSKGHFHGVNLPNSGPSLSHLLFTDDVIFVGKWSILNVVNLSRILRCFHLASGLKAPKKVIDSIESIRRKFIGGVSNQGSNKICWVSWEKTIVPKNLGGFGIGSLKAANISLLSKWWWRIMTEESALWVKAFVYGINGFPPVNCFIWRLLLKRLPTRTKLRSRGINIHYNKNGFIGPFFRTLFRSVL
ncbi:hypothetical protein OSB04_020153 [Centaurea solstitialis]|uniref:Reverse transcriptase domain-containing protein n=1 Tax=Centaurea solstitialis TaxID=347529 RepID=A0AA38WD06_9ASTR|nr:hypothetical protein OSB04_020153 [Centaurea solstitialis]